MRNRVLIALVMMLAGCLLPRAYAGPAHPGTVTLTQSDGTSFRAQIHGDEYFNYITTSDGYSVVGGADGDWYFARLDSRGALVTTGIKAAPASRLSASQRAGLKKNLRPTTVSRSRMVPTPAEAAPSSLCPPHLGGTSIGTSGKTRVLVILVEYTDVKFSYGNGRAAFDELMNSRSYTRDGATGSVWQYYHDNSDGKFDPEFTVIGPYTLAHERSYYSADNDAKAAEMASEAVKLADPYVDYSQYATDGVGHDVFIFYAGGQRADGSAAGGVWPHRYAFPSVTLDGVILSGYACSSELCLRNDKSIGFTPIGSFCHEFGHVLGLPDYYDTDGTSDADSPCFYSLMDVGCYNNDSRTPPALGIMERWMLGWSEPEFCEDAGEYTLAPVTEGKGYMIRSEASGEYFLLECRGAGKTVWDKASYMDYYGLGESWGLMVWYADVSRAASWRGNVVNCTPGSERFTVVYSNSAYRGNTRPAHIPGRSFFPGSDSVTELRSGTTEGFAARNGSLSYADISGIRLNGAEGTVSFSIVPHTPEIGGLNFRVWQHDALVSWTDEESGSWTVSWTPADGGESCSVTVTGPEAHLSGLEPGTKYSVRIVSDRKGSRSFTLTSSTETGGFPRIAVSSGTLSAAEPLLFTLLDCGGYTGVQWTVDGAKSENYRTLKPGERRIQACVTLPDGSREYYLRYVNVEP
jgi:immune inhibitor A